MSMSSPFQLEKLMSLPADAPVGALNLFQFNPRAQYQPGDPEYGTPEADVSGEEAFARYGASAGPFVVGCGGRVVFSTPVDQVMIGPDQPAWDVAAIMYFPTRRAFVEMLSDPAFQKASRHRKAALANHCMLHLAGGPFKL
jgi:uncharacterized protein (DUF1330 family)